VDVDEAYRGVIDHQPRDNGALVPVDPANTASQLVSRVLGSINNACLPLYCAYIQISQCVLLRGLDENTGEQAYQALRVNLDVWAIGSRGDLHRILQLVQPLSIG